MLVVEVVARTRTFVMGPKAGIEPGSFILDRKAAMAWLAPSGRMNCSRNSTLVLPLAVLVVRRVVSVR